MKNRTMERSNSADYNNDDNEYNPFENREVSKPLKYRDGIFHLVAAFISRGLITLPLAIHKAGLLCSFVFVSFLWICYPYIIHCLMVTKHRVEKDSKVPYLSYPKLVYIAFQTGPMFFKSIAKYVRLVTIVFYLFYHVVKCLTVTTDICLIVAKIYGLEYKDDKALMSLYKFLLLVPIILMTYFIKTLRGVNFAAYIAVICHTICLFTLFVIIYFIGYETLSLKNIIWIGSFADVLELVVLSTYSLEPLGLFIAVERNLDQPELFYGFTGLLSTANFGILVILIFLSILGSIVPHDAKNDDELKGIKVSYLITSAIALLFTYPLFYFVSVEILWESIWKQAENNEEIAWIRPILSILLNLIIVISSIAIPWINEIVFITNAILTPLLCILIPDIVEMIYDYGKEQTNRFTMIKESLIFLIFLITITAKLVFIVIIQFVHPLYRQS